MKCESCGTEITEGDSYVHLGRTLCDDCYLDARQTVRTCDPWAVYSASRTRESSGLSGTEGLTKLQKDIYDFVCRKGKIAAEEISSHFGLSESELQSQFAILRHCELLRGQKEADRVYIVPFS